MGAVGVLTLGVARGFGPGQTGALAACYTVALGCAAPVWGALADRRGLPLVLRLCVGANLAGTALLLVPSYGTSVAGALLLGVGTPPVAAAMRATWNRLLPAGAPRVRASDVESILAEGVHIVGRILVAALAAVTAQTIVLVQALLLTVGGLGLSLDRRLGPAASVRLGSSPAMTMRRGWPLFLVTLLASAAHGCVATVFAVVPSTAVDGPLLMTAWGVGSFVGGSAFARWRDGRPVASAVPVGLLLFAFLCLTGIVAFEYGFTAQVVMAFVLGLPLAPTFSGLYTVAGEVAPVGRENETFAIMSSVVVVAFGMGTGLTGALSARMSALVGGFGAASGLTLAALSVGVLALRPRKLGQPTNVGRC
ncbi:hypothetical protein ACI8AA_01475 [Geodermatophilus sp. SYSU D01180]